jgi:hypothetical protein
MTIVKRSVARLGQLPPTMEPSWPKDLTPTEHANKLKSYNAQQAKYNRNHCDFELAAAFTRRAMEHHECYNVASMRRAELAQRAREHNNFSNVPTLPDDNLHMFATTLELHPPGQQNCINMMDQHQTDPSIRKFERGGNCPGRNTRPTREGTRGEGARGDGKPKETCPCCLHQGHSLEKGSVCWMGAQVENMIKHNKDNPIQAKQNMENIKLALNPATIAKMQAQFLDDFQNVEPDSAEMMEAAAVELFKMFHVNKASNKGSEA